MSATALEKVRSEALNLSEAERAELAYNLVASLDGPADPDVEKAWDAEIMRRLAEIDSGRKNCRFPALSHSGGDPFWLECGCQL